MSKKANPATIGLFVCIALVIAGTAIVTLGMGKIFKDRTTYVMYFDGALSGLDIGAPVKIHGVRVGSVCDIRLIYDHQDKSIQVPVYIEIERDAFSEQNLHMAGAEGSGMRAHIQRGLRAQLNTQSIVTGELQVDLVYAKNDKPVMRGHDTSVEEIPTIPNTLETVFERLGELPLEEIVQNLNKSTESIAKVMSSGELETLVANMTAISADVKTLSKGMSNLAKEGHIEEIVKETRTALNALTESLESADLNKTMASIDKTLSEGQELMKNSQAFVKNMDRNSTQLQKDLAMALEDIADAARASRHLLEYLERHPEALIRGKGEE